MNNKLLLERTYSDRRYRAGLHIIFWLLMFASYYYFNTISFNASRQTPATYLLAMKNAIEFALAFYLLMYFIWPRFLARGKWFKGIVLIFFWLVLLAVLDAVADQQIFGRCQVCGDRLREYYNDYYTFLQRDFISIVLVRVVTGGFLYHLIIQLSLPVAIKIGRNYFRQTVHQLQLSRENLQLEFNFLKAQVNPHFLFNTLNNIYSLVMSDRKEQAGATIARLSGLMRYTLYETADEKILLEKEVRLLNDYTELEKLRLNHTDVEFNYRTDRDDYTIPPLLFMPALENAFKYASDSDEGNHIQVDVEARDAVLKVSIRNRFDPQRKQKAGGIGLQNLQKRLQHYYTGRSSYSATVANDVYLFQLSCVLA